MSLEPNNVRKIQFLSLSQSSIVSFEHWQQLFFWFNKWNVCALFTQSWCSFKMIQMEEANTQTHSTNSRIHTQPIVFFRPCFKHKVFDSQFQCGCVCCYFHFSGGDYSNCGDMEVVSNVNALSAFNAAAEWIWMWKNVLFLIISPLSSWKHFVMIFDQQVTWNMMKDMK